MKQLLPTRTSSSTGTERSGTAEVPSVALVVDGAYEYTAADLAA
jgi:hypothetical protein